MTPFTSSTLGLRTILASGMNAGMPQDTLFSPGTGTAILGALQPAPNLNGKGLSKTIFNPIVNAPVPVPIGVFPGNVTNLNPGFYVVPATTLANSSSAGRSSGRWPFTGRSTSSMPAASSPARRPAYQHTQPTKYRQNQKKCCRDLKDFAPRLFQTGSQQAVAAR